MSTRRLPKLVLIEPSGVRRDVPLARTPLTIGRRGDCDLALRDSRISRRQAVIETDDGCYLIEDCGSRHGTFVNGRRVETPRKLQNNDRIEFGIQDSYALIFVSEEEGLRALLDRVDTPERPDAVSQKLQKLTLLLEASRSLHAGLALGDVLTVVVDACLSVTGTERGCILLRDRQGQLEFRVGRDRSQRSLAREDFDVNHAAIRGAAEEGRDTIVGGRQAETPPPSAASGPEPSTVICLPLHRLPSAGSLATTAAASVHNVLGVLYLDAPHASSHITKTERQILRSLAGEAASVLETARLFAAARAKEHLDQELAIARGIQKKLLPQGTKQYGFFQVTFLSMPCHEVGGDYYDVIEVPDRGFAFVIADVTGKGISAALLSSTLQGALVAGLQSGQPVAGVECHLNRYLYQHTEENNFATFFCGLLTPEGCLEYVNAGHLPAFWVTPEQIVPLAADNVPLGLFEQRHCRSREIRLRSNDLLVLYSDGVVEASNAREEFYGLQRLNQVLCTCRSAPPEKVAQCVIDDIRAFTDDVLLEDDVSLMIVRYQSTG